MKAKIPILIAAGMFLVIASKAQFPIGGQVVIQGRVVLPAPPVPVVVGYDYDNPSYGRYEERRDWRDDGRRDWREDEYERYRRRAPGIPGRPPGLLPRSMRIQGQAPLP